ncbi:helix-turn-helix domain-containing protein [Radiobacillus kanasensis]|uniref:helix-turn-helix domain-containing protein n=1 Tax=Radiobacillus kanasensis TaxID=2844358 RepID=UPI001E38F559|nr:helix-turn-helix transcriptional regulator [Radiobacillus kanasensis]UFT99991.1 helix-turn-helix domain-containing protein [Radiobacillus kanasensis]
MPNKALISIIGERLRTLRKERNLSQEDLANISSLHPTYIGQLERGEKNATIETLEKVTNGLGVSLEQFFRFTETNGDKKDEVILQLKTLLYDVTDEDQEVIVKIIQVLLEWRDKAN